jgi:hypothetical protein
MRARLRITTALVLAATLAACGGGDKDSTGPTGNAAVVGTYTLRTANGQPLPTTVTAEGLTVTVKSGSVALNADGSCSHRLEVSTVIGGTPINDTTTYFCTYPVNGNNVVATDTDDGAVTAGTVSGTTLTVAEEGISLVYQR